MKKLILLSAFATALLMACRKETPVELPSGITVAEPTCTNGVMDGNEDGVDCGASTCVPCLLSHPIMCNEFTDNRLVAGGVTTDFYPDEVTSSTTSGKLIITANHNNSSYIFRVTFASADPEVFHKYECEDNNTPEAGKVFVEYANGSSVKTAYYGEVHLNRENGKYTLEVCDISMGFPYIQAKTRLISSN